MSHVGGAAVPGIRTKRRRVSCVLERLAALRTLGPRASPAGLWGILSMHLDIMPSRYMHEQLNGQK